MVQAERAYWNDVAAAMVQAERAYWSRKGRGHVELRLRKAIRHLGEEPDLLAFGKAVTVHDLSKGQRMVFKDRTIGAEGDGLFAFTLKDLPGVDIRLRGEAPAPAAEDGDGAERFFGCVQKPPYLHLGEQKERVMGLDAMEKLQVPADMLTEAGQLATGLKILEQTNRTD
jgi:hypothetical protein